jgi:serine/threonine protein kinase
VESAPNTERTQTFEVDGLGSGYVIERVISEGAASVLFAAAKNGKRYLVKRLKTDDAAVALRFERTSPVLVRLDHPNLVRVHEAGIAKDGSPWRAMEWLEGQDCEERIATGGTLGIDEAIRFLREACAGVAALHDAKLLHGELVTSRLFITRDRKLRVLDVGLAIRYPRLDTRTSLRMKPGELAGTSHNMPPEHVRGEELDDRSDVWALGACLFRLLTHRFPFPGENVYEVCAAILKEPPTDPLRYRPDLAPTVVDVIRRCLEKAPRDRYQSVRALSDALGEARDAERHTPIVATTGAVLDELRASRALSSRSMRTTPAVTKAAAPYESAAVATVRAAPPFDDEAPSSDADATMVRHADTGSVPRTPAAMLTPPRPADATRKNQSASMTAERVSNLPSTVDSPQSSTGDRPNLTQPIDAADDTADPTGIWDRAADAIGDADRTTDPIGTVSPMRAAIDTAGVTDSIDMAARVADSVGPAAPVTHPMGAGPTDPIDAVGPAKTVAAVSPIVRAGRFAHAPLTPHVPLPPQSPPPLREPPPEAEPPAPLSAEVIEPDEVLAREPSSPSKKADGPLDPPLWTPAASPNLFAPAAAGSAPNLFGPTAAGSPQNPFAPTAAGSAPNLFPPTAAGSAPNVGPLPPGAPPAAMASGQPPPMVPPPGASGPPPALGSAHPPPMGSAPNLFPPPARSSSAIPPATGSGPAFAFPPPALTSGRDLSESIPRHASRLPFVAAAVLVLGIGGALFAVRRGDLLRRVDHTAEAQTTPAASASTVRSQPPLATATPSETAVAAVAEAAPAPTAVPEEPTPPSATAAAQPPPVAKPIATSRKARPAPAPAPRPTATEDDSILNKRK